LIFHGAPWSGQAGEDETTLLREGIGVLAAHENAKIVEGGLAAGSASPMAHCEQMEWKNRNFAVSEALLSSR
jgi:hypothetical protein